jgi:hypothetical protein
MTMTQNIHARLLKDINLEILDWPAQSPDLDPIEPLE